MGERTEITFTFTRAGDFRVVAANGVHGGVTGRGDFRFELFVESPQLPDSVTHSITPDGLGPETDREPQHADIVRESQIAVVMQVEQARSFAHWILERIKHAEQQKAT